MLPYVIAGLVSGGIYAIAATGLVITFQAAGVLNFSFGAIAFTVARFYYFLHVQESLSILPSALLSILVLGPLMGLLLYVALFRFLHQSSTLVKVLATIGVSVALPSADLLIFGNQPILSAPGLAPQPVKVFHLLGVGITLDQIIVYGCVILLMAAGFFVLRYTDVGLRVRSMVDSPALMSLSGSNPNTMSMGVWVVSTTLAGLVGVLMAPLVGLSAGDMTLVMIAAFAAVIAAKLRHVLVAALVGLGMGIAEALIQWGLPPSSAFTADILPSVPFLVAACFLVYYTVSGSAVDESDMVGGALDRAIRTNAGSSVSAATGGGRSLSWRPSLVAFALLCGVPLLLHGQWIGLTAEGVAFGVIFLSFSLVTGEGGMIWLCQATFAAIGGLSAGLLTAHDHLPILLSVLIGGLIAAPVGALVGILTIRMGDLYIALVTLTFGLLAENLVFNQPVFFNNGIGTTVDPPAFASTPLVLTYVCIAIFAVIALFIVNLRRATTGLAFGAVRSSTAGSKMLGINVLQMKVILATIAAFVAGIGGGLLAITMGVALPSNYDTLAAEVWLAILVTQGIRSNTAALIAGLSETILAALAANYLPQSFGNVLPILFGLGAISMVKYPEGIVSMQARQIRSLLARVQEHGPRIYQRLKIAEAIYLVAFVVVVVVVRDLWWLWIAITIVVQNVVALAIYRSRSLREAPPARRTPDAEVKKISV